MNVINPRPRGDPPCSAHTRRRTRAVRTGPLSGAVVVVVAAAAHRGDVDVGTLRPTASPLCHIDANPIAAGSGFAGSTAHITFAGTDSALTGSGGYARNWHRSATSEPTGSCLLITKRGHRESHRPDDRSPRPGGHEYSAAITVLTTLRVSCEPAPASLLFARTRARRLSSPIPSGGRTPQGSKHISDGQLQGPTTFQRSN